tara:strand:- start:437 stop:1000 length:564 start_codon:yes stop_codon:yes gene_type:complete
MAITKLGGLGLGLQIGGIFTSAIAAGAKADAEKYKFKSQALSLQHKKDMALFNKGMKESQAQHIARTFDKRYQIMTIRQGNQKGKATASFAARGGVLGYGSTRDAFLSNDIMSEMDKLAMNSNKVKAVQDKKLEAVGLGIQANMYGVSASNAFTTASAIDPFSYMSNTLLTGASSLISSLPKEMLYR